MPTSTPTTSALPVSAPARGRRSRLGRFLAARTGIVTSLLLIAAMLAVGAVLSDRFRTAGNLLNVFEQSSGLAFVSLGQTLAILTGGIDLSVGSLISLVSVLTAGLIDGDSARTLPVVAAMLALGLGVGAVNGLAVIRLRIHPLIVTLGTGAILQGITLLYALGPVGSAPPEFDAIAYGKLFGLPASAVLAVVAFVLVALFLRYVPFGRQIYAVGDDAHAARLMGLPHDRVIVFVYAFCGLCAALTAIYLVGRFGSGQPYQGANYTLASITPVVVGGTLLSGGRGGVIGTLIGAYLISLLNNLLNFMDVSSHVQLIVQGLIIILAVSVYIERRRSIA
ncbi:ribose transport system permease protein [Pseudoxanthobacter soli DSM 19599]|uniref:Ribose transport system permease protein n=1 Tax=Pseudoxanthobacter soli DSM 19599 TaxID=1123029 RepID=A0A1M7ZPN9_9HYPH|nr:ABC transporter permease [Pseudoxanthobacter soli]SHO66831.1 ribose transport system permease protein [Pseudoxanthobacter soli DSM 19599]